MRQMAAVGTEQLKDEIKEAKQAYNEAKAAGDQEKMSDALGTLGANKKELKSRGVDISTLEAKDTASKANKTEGQKKTPAELRDDLKRAKENADHAYNRAKTLDIEDALNQLDKPIDQRVSSPKAEAAWKEFETYRAREVKAEQALKAANVKPEPKAKPLYKDTYTGNELAQAKAQLTDRVKAAEKPVKNAAHDKAYSDADRVIRKGQALPNAQGRALQEAANAAKSKMDDSKRVLDSMLRDYTAKGAPRKISKAGNPSLKADERAAFKNMPQKDRRGLIERAQAAYKKDRADWFRRQDLLNIDSQRIQENNLLKRQWEKQGKPTPKPPRVGEEAPKKTSQARTPEQLTKDIVKREKELYEARTYGIMGTQFHRDMVTLKEAAKTGRATPEAEAAYQRTTKYHQNLIGAKMDYKVLADRPRASNTQLTTVDKYVMEGLRQRGSDFKQAQAAVNKNLKTLDSTVTKYIKARGSGPDQAPKNTGPSKTSERFPDVAKIVGDKINSDLNSYTQKRTAAQTEYKAIRDKRNSEKDPAKRAALDKQLVISTEKVLNQTMNVMHEKKRIAGVMERQAAYRMREARQAMRENKAGTWGHQEARLKEVAYKAQYEKYGAKVKALDAQITKAKDVAMKQQEAEKARQSNALRNKLLTKSQPKPPKQFKYVTSLNKSDRAWLREEKARLKSKPDVLQSGYNFGSGKKADQFMKFLIANAEGASMVKQPLKIGSKTTYTVKTSMSKDQLNDYTRAFTKKYGF